MMTILLALSAQLAAAAPVEILSVTPSGELTEPRDSIEVVVTFNQPMVPLASPEDTGKTCPVTIKPSVPGVCRWQGNNVLTFVPEKPLPLATAYGVRVAAGLTSQVSGETLAEEQRWSFTTMRPGLVRSEPSHGAVWRQPKEDVFLQFNMAVDPKAVRKWVRLYESRGNGPKEEIPVGVRRATPEEIKALWPYPYGIEPSTHNALALHPSRPLSRQSRVDVVLEAGLKGAQGALGTTEAKILTYETYGPFEFLEPTGELSFCLPQSVSLTFSNPIPFQELLKSVRFSPEVEISTEILTWNPAWTGSLDTSARKVNFELWAALKPDSFYSLIISSGLRDEGGALLGRTVAIPVRAQGYCPYYDMLSGVGVLEGYLPPLQPAEVLNASPVRVRMAKLTEEQFVPFHKNWNSQSRTAPAVVPAPVHEYDWTPDVPRNARLWQGIDLRPVLGDAKNGIVFLETYYKDSWQRALLNVTRLGLTIKSSPDDTLVAVSFLRKPNPAKGAQVELRDDENKVLWAGVTDKNGLVRAPGWKVLGLNPVNRWETPRLWVFARVGQDSAVAASDWKGGISPWRFHISYDSTPRPDHYSGSLFTDRGIYRTGETVHLKGLLRRIEKGDWVLSGIDRVFVAVKDPRGSEVFKGTVAVSALSSFDLSFSVPEGAPTGYWQVRAAGYKPGEGESLEPVVKAEETVEGDEEEGWRPVERTGPNTPLVTLYEGFRVEPFKPASFEVRVTPLKEDWVAGETFEAAADGWYLFGAPMADAAVEWKLRLEPASFTPPDREGYHFGPGWWVERQEEGKLLASADGKLDEKGKIAVSSVLDTGGVNRTMRAVLEASVTNPERQRLSGRGSVNVHPAEFYVGLKPSRYFGEKGRPLACDMLAVRPDGKAAEGVQITAHLTRRFWQSVQKTGIGGRLEWVSEQRDVVVATRTYTSGKEPIRFDEVPTETGEYILEAEARDSQGRRSSSGVLFYVIGKGEAWWAREDTDIIELVPEKKDYKPGDTAQIMVKSPYENARAMVTLEREGVLDTFFVDLSGGADFISVPLADKHVPNVFVGVMLLQGRTQEKVFVEDRGDDLGKPQIKVGYAALNVNPGGRRLAVSVETDAKEYRPGAKVKAKVQVQGADKAGSRSEVTLYVVDEGVLSLTGYGTPDVFNAFYGPRSLQVGTADNRLYVIGQRNFGHKGRPRGGGGGESLAGIDLRTRFVPTVFWAPSLATDAQGRAEVEFTLPDNLTRFRVMAVVHEGKRFGSGEAKFTVKKPLMLRPSLPRFARIGDVFKGGMVVHNYTAADATVTFKADIRGDAVSCGDSGGAQERFVAAGRAAELLWDCQAKSPGKGTFEFAARTGGETDGLRWEVPVIVPVKLETVATLGAVGEPAKEKIEPPKGALPGIGGLQVGLSATALSGLQEGVRFLLGYPYGCLEQKLSMVMPVLVSADLVSTFGLGDLSGLKEKVREVLTKMPLYQVESGGFTYWLNGWRKPDPYLTSYALHAIALAEREGYYVDRGMKARAVSWLERYVKGQEVKTAYPYTEEEALVSRAYSVYTLALNGSPQEAAVDELFSLRNRLNLEGMAHLARAAAKLGMTPVAQAVSGDMLNRVRVSPTTLYFDPGETEQLEWIHGSAVRTTAVGLQALLEARDGFPGDEKAVRWLIEERKIRGRWRTTQENSAALQAFQDFYRRYEKDSPDFTARVAVGEGSWTERFLGRDMGLRLKDFPMTALEGRSTPVSVSREGPGRLYYTLRLSYAPGESAPAKDMGMSVTRTVKKLYGPGEGEALGPGARAVVTLKVKTPKVRTFVALENPLPAGFEIVDTSYATESQEDARLLSDRAERGDTWGGFERSESYDDRIVAFADYLTEGEHTWSFLVQATVAGAFSAPPPSAEQMYQPEVFGRGAGERVEIR
ncbi:MAG: MG2 domain-containing protein [Elusimicrobiota bacterium]